VTLSNFQRRADDPHQVYDESRRGPVRDSGGRIKPDIVAPGTFVLSTRSTVSTADLGPDGLEHTAQVDAAYADDADGVATHAEAVGLGLPGRPIFGSAQQAAPPAPLGSGPLAQENYCYLSGTSMATAVASGAVTLLRQYLRQHRGVDRPSAALMKALILNSATVPDGESPVPDNVRGFGWLDLDRLFAPAPAGSRQLLVDDRDQAVATGEIRTFPIRAVDPGVPLRVTLVWSDSPGVRLQNRLYLRLLPPSGGAALDGDVTAFPHASNNAQRVHIDDPGTGVWTIQVHGIGVSFPIPALAPSLCQDFALAISNANFA
jgi:subtilisin family serine protease